MAAIFACRDADLEVRLHALEVLATYPVAGNDSAYTECLTNIPPAHHPGIHRARTRFCEILVHQGEYRAARSVAKSILASQAPAPQKRAARILLDRSGR